MKYIYIDLNSSIKSQIHVIFVQKKFFSLTQMNKNHHFSKIQFNFFLILDYHLNLQYLTLSAKNLF